MTTCSGREGDWTQRRHTRAIAWHIPEIALIVAIFLDPGVRTVVWSISLLWMGVACILNARRCGRRHCFYTGPFFVVTGVIVALHGSEIVSLGQHGWWWLGVVTVVGGYGVLWTLLERYWGEYIARP
ncbi:MAG: hypothetical protein E4H01_16990 [Lysobacterales bacterium]|nr:MAG: hypothetical protein E4H01_16990 [Xanthomonadales bacterium]